MKSARSITLLALAALTFAAQADEKDTDLPTDKVAKFMRGKLVHAQDLLAALAVEDYNGLAKHSQALSLLSQESMWNVLQTPEYIQHSHDFRHRADALTAAAKQKNIDGATLAYVELTVSCVKCHKHIRDVRMKPAPPKK